MCQHSLAGVRQHLAARGVGIARTHDGFAVWAKAEGRSRTQTIHPCLDSAYIHGIKLKPVSHRGHC